MNDANDDDLGGDFPTHSDQEDSDKVMSKIFIFLLAKATSAQQNEC
jgi:hypothetical protein